MTNLQKKKLKKDETGYNRTGKAGISRVVSGKMPANYLVSFLNTYRIQAFVDNGGPELRLAREDEFVE